MSTDHEEIRQYRPSQAKRQHATESHTLLQARLHPRLCAEERNVEGKDDL
jgi:hypothetical protein